MRAAVSAIVIGAVLLAFGAFSVAAAPLVDVRVDKKGTYIYWFAYTDALGAARVSEPGRFKGTSAKIDAGQLGVGFKNARLFVMDKRSSNTAVVDYKAPKDVKSVKPIELSSEDFGYVRRMTLRVVAQDNRPLARGIVTITDGNGSEMSSVVTPADLGQAVFENVAAGEINVKVQADGLTKTVDSDFELPLKRTSPLFERNIRVAGDVETVAIRAEPPDGHNASPRTAERGLSALGAVLQFITGVLLLVVAVAVIVVILRGRGITAKSALKSLGVSMPDEQAAPANAESAPAVDPNVCQFCGQVKDAAGRCACTVVPGAPAGVSQGGPAGAAPRLVGTQGLFAGHVFEIAGGLATIGRDHSNTIVLADDSTASRRHASVTLSGTDYLIRDEGSSNGTFVNGVRVAEQRLSSGDEIQIGASRFRFEL